MTIFLMHPADARAWPAMPQVINRMCQFSADEHGRLEPDLVVTYLSHFITELVHPDQVRQRCWVKVEDDGTVSGHIVVDLCSQNGLPYGSVTQFASDHGFPFPREAGAELWAEIQDWVKNTWGGLQMRIRARTSVHARAYRMLYGFHETKQITMKKEL
jgi:hypothetical protein